MIAEYDAAYQRGYWDTLYGCREDEQPAGRSVLYWLGYLEGASDAEVVDGVFAGVLLGNAERSTGSHLTR